MPSKVNEYAYEQSTIGAVTVTTSSTLVIAANPNRRNAVIVNVDASNAVYLAIGRTAELSKGIMLKENGGAYEINALNMTHAAIYGIASGSTALSYSEGT